MRNIKACCFSGHRIDKLTGSLEAIKIELEKAIHEAILDGYNIFYHGGCNGIDLVAAELVLQFRIANPIIRLIAILPYEGQANNWTKEWRDRYLSVLKRCNSIITLHTNYIKGCYQERNKYMVDRSSRLIAAYNGSSSGGTRNTIKYAYEQDIKVKIIIIP